MDSIEKEIQVRIVMTIKWKVVFASIALFFSVAVLDYIFFGMLFFQFPNEMEWDTSPWYNFLHKTSHIQFADDEKGSLIVGSSVALYSALPSKIQEELNTNVKWEKVRVELYSHVAMSPTDFYYYIEDVISKKPKLVLFLFNPGDFQLDHFRENENRLTYSEKARIEEYKSRIPVLSVYPWLFLKDHVRDISKNDIFLLLTKSILKVNRYRSFFNDPIDAYIERHYRRSRSYHNYTGAMPKEGVWSKGFTTQKFQIECSLKNGKLEDSIFIPKENWTVSVFGENGFSKILKFEKTGWYDLNLEFHPDTKNIKLVFESDKTVSSKEIDHKQYGKEYFYGIRLSQNFCKNELNKDISYNREDYLDEHRFDSMSKDEYEKDYFERMYSNSENRPETHRLKLLKDRKIQLSKSDFVTWSEIENLKKIAIQLKEKNIRFVIVNNPENPIELTFYENSKWYKDFLHYLNGISEINSGKLYDLKNFIQDEKLFTDPHHLTYKGASLMTKTYARIIQENLK
ncbi:MAG: hypothetical protein HS129_16655 [Leptospiraceae bacterium]|nr:hypothetical protein [Leptospiraceae bacterium]